MVQANHSKTTKHETAWHEIRLAIELIKLLIMHIALMYNTLMLTRSMPICDLKPLFWSGCSGGGEGKGGEREVLDLCGFCLILNTEWTFQTPGTESLNIKQRYWITVAIWLHWTLNRIHSIRHIIYILWYYTSFIPRHYLIKYCDQKRERQNTHKHQHRVCIQLRLGRPIITQAIRIRGDQLTTDISDSMSTCLKFYQ